MYCGIQWYTDIYGILWYTMIYHDIQWYTGILWYTKIYTPSLSPLRVLSDPSPKPRNWLTKLWALLIETALTSSSPPHPLQIHLNLRSPLPQLILPRCQIDQRSDIRRSFHRAPLFWKQPLPRQCHPLLPVAPLCQTEGSRFLPAHPHTPWPYQNLADMFQRTFSLRHETPLVMWMLKRAWPFHPFPLILVPLVRERLPAHGANQWRGLQVLLQTCPHTAVVVPVRNLWVRRTLSDLFRPYYPPLMTVMSFLLKITNLWVHYTPPSLPSHVWWLPALTMTFNLSQNTLDQSQIPRWLPPNKSLSSPLERVGLGSLFHIFPVHTPSHHP